MKNFQSLIMLTLLATFTGIYASEEPTRERERENLINFSSEGIQSRLNSIGLTHFAEKTDIVNSLRGPKVPMGVAMAIELAYADYYEDLQKGMPAPMFRMMQVTMEMQKPLLYKTLLREHPAALAELQQLGMYNPEK